MCSSDLSREEGADNAVAILSKIKGYAEQKNVDVCMEITNSKVVADQRTDQIFDHLAWGLDVCKRVNSPRVKVLFDIYHVQIMDGDVVRTMRVVRLGQGVDRTGRLAGLVGHVAQRFGGAGRAASPGHFAHPAVAGGCWRRVRRHVWLGIRRFRPV